ncbi:unnamed protein product [Ectocarpus sp. 6 AP-2014]
MLNKCTRYWSARTGKQVGALGVGKPGLPRARHMQGVSYRELCQTESYTLTQHSGIWVKKKRRGVFVCLKRSREIFQRQRISRIPVHTDLLPRPRWLRKKKEHVLQQCLSTITTSQRRRALPTGLREQALPSERCTHSVGKQLCENWKHHLPSSIHTNNNNTPRRNNITAALSSDKRAGSKRIHQPPAL